MNEIRYREDRPQDCSYCYWYMDESGCVLSRGCYYELIDEPEEERETHPCDGCPYARPIPCLGYCLKKLMGKRQKGPAGTSAAAFIGAAASVGIAERKEPNG